MGAVFPIKSCGKAHIYCKECRPQQRAKAGSEEAKQNRLEYTRKWHTENSKHDKEYKEKYYANNTEKILRDAKKYYLEHSEERKEYSRQWREENPDKVAEQQRRYRQEYADKVYAKNAKRRALLKGATVEDVDPTVVYNRDMGICQLCFTGVSRDTMSLDHIVPLIHGGEHSYNNIQLAHISCNSKKGASLQNT